MMHEPFYMTIKEITHLNLKSCNFPITTLREHMVLLSQKRYMTNILKVVMVITIINLFTMNFISIKYLMLYFT